MTIAEVKGRALLRLHDAKKTLKSLDERITNQHGGRPYLHQPAYTGSSISRSLRPGHKGASHSRNRAEQRGKPLPQARTPLSGLSCSR